MRIFKQRVVCGVERTGQRTLYRKKKFSTSVEKLTESAEIACLRADKSL